MYYRQNQKYGNGFALPTILISSIVMLIVLLVSITGTTTVRNQIKNQYYQQLAQVAGEAGVAYAEACLNANGGVPTWTNAAPLKPNTDCSGSELVSCPTTSTDPLCSVSLNGNIRSSFSIGLPPIEKPSALVVAGGGSGGGSTGGGGGAGGVIYAPSIGLSVGPYSVTVGAGGAIPGNKLPGLNGENSTFNGITAIGGGGGGYSASSTVAGRGQDGGSGGGGENYSTSSFPAGRGASGQGNDGGDPGTSSAGGGGGAGGPGGTGVGTNIGGPGGAGIANSITGVSVLYGGGGGGGNTGAAGSGGGGAGSTSSGVGGNGTANTGGGGGGGWAYTGGNGGSGGSGVVIVRYPTGVITATGGNSTTTSGNYTIKKFTSSGTLDVTAVSNAITTIPNTGFVEELRNSNSAVWRRYDQKQAPASAVPDLCSGSAKAIYGWNNATVVPSTLPFSGPPVSAIQIGVGALNPGPNYFRKDFSVTSAGTYTFAGIGGAIFDAYIDGVLRLSWSGGGAATQSVSLNEGCHTIIVRAVNGIILPNSFELIMSLTKSGSTVPIVQTDSSWRVGSGTTVHYSDSRYSQSSAWTPVREVQLWSASTVWAAGSLTPAWDTTSGDTTAYWVSTTHSYTSTANYPANSSVLFRDSEPIVLSSPVNVRLSYACDDNCDIWLDGTLVASGSVWSTVQKTDLTISEGKHTFAVMLTNGSVGASGLLFAAVDMDTGTVLTDTNASSWVASNEWYTNAQNPYSFDNTYKPNPNLPSSTVKVLVVGGGGGGGSSIASNGGGGGGGGGGVIYNASYTVSGSIPVTVGAGGSGGKSAAGQNGSNGENSVFDTLTAIGGGGGGNGSGANANAGLLGGSGGGAGYNVYVIDIVGTGLVGQGYNGGQNGAVSGAGAGGGGGAGSAGSAPTNSPLHNGGTGGAGISNSISGVSTYYGGGGGGGGNAGSGGAGGSGGGGSGNSTSGTANTGGGGGGVYANVGAAGNGGSGVVIISYPTGSMTATGGTITTSGGNTIHKFTSSGTFTVISIP